MGKKLYVGNLPYATTEDSLREAFGQSGTVESATIIIDRETGRSKGFGFVEMSNQYGRPPDQGERSQAAGPA